MTYQKIATELTIISANDMRSYAEGALPEEAVEFAEQTLLDDDRARKLVLDKTSRPAVSSLSQKSIHELEACIVACRDAAISYEILSQKDNPKTLRQFAAAQFTSRWRLLLEIKRFVSPNEPGLSLQATADPERTASDSPRGDMLENAIRRDNTLETALHNAFKMLSAPHWKAKIAEWIADFQNGRDRVAWLTKKPSAPATR